MDFRLNPQKIALKLISLREQKGVTQSEVATALGLTRSAVSQYEAGIRIPADEIKIKIAKYFETSVQDIFYEI